MLAPDDAIEAVVRGLARDLDDPSHEWPFEGGPFCPWLAATFERCNMEAIRLRHPAVFKAVLASLLETCPLARPRDLN